MQNESCGKWLRDWIPRSYKNSPRKEEWSGSSWLWQLHIRMVVRESLVKSCKIGLKKAVGEQVLTPLELRTCLVEVKNLVNQCPMGWIPSDPDDGSYLCPNVTWKSIAFCSTRTFRHTNNPRHRVEFVQRIVDSFWTCWTRDVFVSLLPRKQWHAEKHNVWVDDFVIVQTSSVICGTWNVGWVVSVYPREDGKVRNVKVRTHTGEY